MIVGTLVGRRIEATEIVDLVVIAADSTRIWLEISNC